MDPVSSENDALTDLLVKARPEQTDFFAQSLRAKVQRSLVGAPGEPFRLGRFTVLEPLGGGGMGVVFVAYDPDLDRKIALKVLRNRGEPGRREVLREGRALARLKHANVVAVYEVGVIDDREFVAMEYVEGKNLREWLREPRPAAAILDRLVEAGRGLAAAHAVDLVHRDFKPENVVIDAAGHARVIDFGLARPLADLSGALGEDPDARGTASLHGGTPAYMAPERLGGAAGDHAADQYSYCVTCWEALFGVRPTDKRAGPAAPRSAPAWLRRVLERGLAPEPARRWPSMAALLAALERGARRVRLRRAALVVLAGLAVGLAIEGLRRRDVARRVAACAASGADIDAAWNAAARQRLREAFAATGVSFAEATVERVLPRLDARAAAWRQARTLACLRADVEARWDADTAARAGFCLEDQQMDLAALVGEFERAEPNTLRHAVRAVDLLKPPASCLDEALLQRQPDPPQRGHEATREARAELSRARSLSLAGKFPAALEVVRAARVRIEAEQAWPPLWAAARGMECASLEETGSYAEAEAACLDAYFAGARAGAWSVAAHAATLLVLITGSRLTRFDDGRVWSRHAELALDNAGERGTQAEARWLSSTGLVVEGSGAPDEARPLYERALAIREASLGADHPETAHSLHDLGYLRFNAGDYRGARALHERVVAAWERAYGPDHPHVAMALSTLGNTYSVVGEYAAARPLQERSLAIAEQALGPDHPSVGSSLINLGIVLVNLGAHAEARAAFQRALGIRERRLGPGSSEVADALFMLADVDYRAGAYGPAMATALRARAVYERALGPEHRSVANVLLLIGNIHARAGEVALARPLYERARTIVEATLGPEHPDVVEALVALAELDLAVGRAGAALPLLERAVSLADAHAGTTYDEFEAHFALARALVATRGGRERALAEAGAARDGFRALGPGKARQLADVERWLAEQAAARAP